MWYSAYNTVVPIPRHRAEYPTKRSHCAFLGLDALGEGA